MEPPGQRGHVPLDYARPQSAPSGMRRAMPYVVFAVCAIAAGLFVSWVPTARSMERYLYVMLAVFFVLAALVLPFLVQRDNQR